MSESPSVSVEQQPKVKKTKSKSVSIVDADSSSKPSKKRTATPHTSEKVDTQEPPKDVETEDTSSKLPSNIKTPPNEQFKVLLRKAEITNRIQVPVIPALKDSFLLIAMNHVKQLQVNDGIIELKNEEPVQPEQLVFKSTQMKNLLQYLISQAHALRGTTIAKPILDRLQLDIEDEMIKLCKKAKEAMLYGKRNTLFTKDIEYVSTYLREGNNV